MKIFYGVSIIILIVIIFIQHKKIKKSEKKQIKLKELIDKDYLTKSYSKKHIYENLQKLKAKNKEFSIIMFDLDNFKFINDNYGHNFGDEVLIKVVEAIKVVIVDKGIIGRFGGEEFVVILENSNNELCDTIFQIKQAVKNIKLSYEDVSITISGGAKKYNGENIDALISKVDKLLYVAKNRGKNNLIIGN